MKKIFAIILAAMLLLTLVSCGNKEDGKENGNEIQAAVKTNVYTDAATGDKFAYESDDLGGYVITSFTSATSTPHKVVVPAEIENVEVTGVGAGAFKFNGYVSEVEVPDSVIYIDNFAFYGCEYLTKVTVADSVTTIGAGAFEHCVALKEVKLSSAITEVSAYLFNNCKLLKSVAIPAGVTEIGEGAFMGCAFEEVVIPAAVKKIGDCAYYNNIALVKATVPATVETLGQFVFNAAAETFVLVGAEGSAAQTYAAENDYTFEVLA